MNHPIPDTDLDEDNDFSPACQPAETLRLSVPIDLAGLRLDAALAKMLPDYSRSRIAGWIKDGEVLCNGQPASPKTKLIGGEQ